jgi:serine/threonine protein kinase
MPDRISSYRLEGEIARGGMGIVYRGVHTVFEEVVAIKAIFSELTLNPELRERFVNEAKIQRRLQHPNIIQIREFLIEQGKFYIVMEYVRWGLRCTKCSPAASRLSGRKIRRTILPSLPRTSTRSLRHSVASPLRPPRSSSRPS